MNDRLVELLDEGIRAIRHGHTTPEDFLARHSAEAAELAPLLHLATQLDARTVPPLAPQARARISARVRGGIRARPGVSHGLRWQRPWLVAAALAAITLVGLGGTGIAARDALPGDPLYGVKRGIERLEPMVRREEAVDRRIRLSKRRLDEVRALAGRRDHARLSAALAAYEEEYRRLLAAAASAPSAAADRAVREAAAQVTTLAELRARDAEPDPSLAALVDRLTVAMAGLAAAPALPERPTAARSAAVPTATLEAAHAGQPDAIATLLQAVDTAERSGVLTTGQAAEVRRLLQPGAARESGTSPDAATALDRLGAALAACAERGCADPATLAALHDVLSGSALALGLPEPAPPRRSGAAQTDAFGTPTTQPPRTNPQVAAPAPPATVAAVGGAPGAAARPTSPTVAAAAPTETTASTSPTVGPAATPSAAHATVVPATPARPPAVAAAAPPTTTAAATPTAGAEAAAPALAAATAAPTTPRSMPTPTSTVTPTPTPTPAGSPGGGR
jgi:hypothetical protein